MNLKDNFLYISSKIPVRFYRRQKIKLLNFIIGEIKNSGHEWFINKDAKKRKSLFATKYLNLVIDDPSKSDYVIIAGYDTPRMIPSRSYKYYPFDAYLTSQEELVGNIIFISIIVIANVMLDYNLFKYFDFGANDTFIKVLVMSLFMIISLFLSYGLPRRNNFNRNNAAVATLLSIIEEMPKNKKVSYCFVDQYAATKGYDVFSETLRSINSKCEVLILDCIANGPRLYFAKGNKHCKLTFSEDYFVPCYLDEEKEDRSPLFFFDHAQIIASGYMNTSGVYVRDMSFDKDKKADLDLMEFVKETVINELNKNI